MSTRLPGGLYAQDVWGGLAFGMVVVVYCLCALVSGTWQIF